MKIVLLNDQIPPEGMGGAESVVWRLAGRLRSEGHEARVIASARSGSFEEWREGIPTYHIQAAYPERFRPWLSLWNPQTAGPLRALLERIRPDVVNAHNIHSYLSYHALKIARDLGMATVFSAHDVMPFAYGKLRLFDGFAGKNPRAEDYRLPRFYNLRMNRLRYNPWRNRVIRHYLSRHAGRITTPSRALADAFAVNSLPAAEVAHNGIDVAEWSCADEEAVAELRRRYDLEGALVLLIAGRLSADKGRPQLMRAMNALKDIAPKMRLLALTDRDIGEEISDGCAHLRPLIRAGGWLRGAELRAAYHLADIALVPSVVFDTFPTVNLEAMAAGKPVIATCFGGSSELVVDGETGFIVNPFDARAFSGRLRLLLEDGGLRRKMGMAGQARVRERFTLEGQVARMLEIYRQAIEERRS